MTDRDDLRRFAPATERNREPILSVLQRVLPEHGTVVEIASGTGQHAVFFAAALPGVRWQPSDVDPVALESISSWAAAEPRANLLPPLSLDVTADPWPVDGKVDAVFSANMIHIAPWEACLGLCRGAGANLRDGGVLILYGPFMVDGVHTAPSNAEFDADLKRRDPRWGVRDLAAVETVAGRHGLVLEERVPMPANNQTVVFRKIAKT